MNLNVDYSKVKEMHACTAAATMQTFKNYYSAINVAIHILI